MNALLLLLVLPATVQIASGPISGKDLGDVTAFLGVPYAAPPIGELRWKPPQSPKPWTETKACTEFGPSCPQRIAANALRQQGPKAMSEDCLTLNVWAPKDAKDAAVLFWIHGGGHQQGGTSTPLYDGQALAEQGVVVVSANYRLGYLGFLAHPELSKEQGGHSGNYGYMDQIAALTWVRDNIERFGGDPARVTVFGQSAGGVSVANLMASPRARGLFHGAILHSGGPTWAMRSLEQAESEGEADMVRAGAHTLEQMRALTPDQLLDLDTTPEMSPGEGAAGWVCVDGWVLTQPTMQVFQAGKAAAVPTMFGATKDDGSMFTRAREARATAAGFERQLQLAMGELAGEALKHYPLDDPAACIRQASTDSFIAAVRRAGVAQRDAGRPVWQWHFARVSPVLERTGLGAVHGAELPYVFGTLPRPIARGRDAEISETLIRAWVNFANTGNPNGAGVPEWPQFGAREQALWIGDEWQIVDGVRAEVCRLFDQASAARGHQ